MQLLRTTTNDPGTSPLPGAGPIADAERTPGAREFPATLDAVIARRERTHARPKSGAKSGAVASADGDDETSAAPGDPPDVAASDSGAASSLRVAELPVPTLGADAAPASVADAEDRAATSDAAVAVGSDAGGIAATLEDTRRAVAFAGGGTTANPLAAAATDATGSGEPPAASTPVAAGVGTERGDAAAPDDAAPATSTPADRASATPRATATIPDTRAASDEPATGNGAAGVAPRDARSAAIDVRGTTTATKQPAPTTTRAAVTSADTLETAADTTSAGTAAVETAPNDGSPVRSSNAARAGTGSAVADGSAAAPGDVAAVETPSGEPAAAPVPVDDARAAGDTSTRGIRDGDAAPVAPDARTAAHAGPHPNTGAEPVAEADARQTPTDGAGTVPLGADTRGAATGAGRDAERAPATERGAIAATADGVASDAGPHGPVHVHTHAAEGAKAFDAGAGGAQTGAEQHTDGDAGDASSAAGAPSLARGRSARPNIVAAATSGATVERARAQNDADAGAAVTAADRGRSLPAPRVVLPAPVATPALHAERAPGLAAWAERIADSVRFSALNGEGEMRVRLEPAGLGSIDIRVSMQHDGVRALIVAEHESTRALLSEQRHVLQAALDRSELRLSGFSVDVGAGGGSGATADPDARQTLARVSVGDDPISRDGDVTIASALPVTTPAGRLSVRV